VRGLPLAEREEAVRTLSRPRDVGQRHENAEIALEFSKIPANVRMGL